ncbi:response regulator transcription factor [Winogradskyella eckloniae]|uniref:LytR/AlgR family response regulator transcription factor n=1 Tax=Winogradskyella eckloniae TaxID=1089306 RepID=UPI0015674A35|nr:LytTR family DNA-binding domain-containing protein [Winogradskyella eckloniae]NRD21385.1 response regulator transcription factor [Winogradskyella eckloniae]
MSKIKAILVDDEISNLKGLELKVNKLFPEIKILKAYQKPEDALKGILELKPDLLFLDIEMPRINGFELLSKLNNIDFQVIFVTAYSEYALEAIKKSAIDYVLKPIDNDDLVLAVNKAKHVIYDKRQSDTNSKMVRLLNDVIENSNKIIIPTAKGVSFIPQDEVLHLEGYEGYTKIHLQDNVIISSYNLGKFEKNLSTKFFKCHKSHIINLEKVRSFENEGYVVLENSIRIPISRANKKVFLSLFK